MNQMKPRQAHRKAIMNNVYQNFYHSFAQAKQAIQCIAPIDYFFAKEMLQALTANSDMNLDTSADNADSSLKESNEHENDAQTLTHVFLALSDSLRAGHTCLPLNTIASKVWGQSLDAFGAASQQGIVNSGAVSQGISFPDYATLKTLFTSLALSAADHKPIVFENDKLYLRRYYQFESELAQDISKRLVSGAQYSEDVIKQLLVQLFPEQSLSEKMPAEHKPTEKIPTEHIAAELTSEKLTPIELISEKLIPTEQESKESIAEKIANIDWQKVAVANAINKNFSVIAGGPGTGKTYTVTKLLAALVMLHNGANIANNTVNNTEKLNIALVAPTGKAAQRLSESLVKAIAGFSGLINDDVLSDVPTNAQTIHRLLGVIPNSPNFRHHQDNKLPYDVVLIDEVSMVDLPLITRVFRALKPHCKVILLGDADQLPSVAAGSVLADIAPRPHNGFSKQNSEYVSNVCQLNSDLLQRGLSSKAAQSKVEQSTNNDYLTYLLKSRRFDGKGGIGLLAKAVIEGDSKNSWQLLSEAKATGSEQLALASSELSVWLAPLIRKYYQPLEKCAAVSDAFALLAQFRVLCATRQGPFGVETINEHIQRYLGKITLNQTANHKRGQHALYHGQPIMISENNYRLGLYNGDIGIIWRVTDTEGYEHLMACFEDIDVQGNDVECTETGDSEAIRYILPSRLPKFETVYAMTIHKTQGSEFDHVAMLLSAGQNESDASKSTKTTVNKLLSRELLYTAITRAKTQLTVASNQLTWQQGVNGQVKRYSGLVLV